MGHSISGYLKAAGEVKSVRQIYFVATAICEDPHALPQLRAQSSALTRKLDQIIDLPIASAPFLASIWRDFYKLRAVLERGPWQAEPHPDARPGARAGPVKADGPPQKKGPAETAALEV
jgi:hypothetical protein